MGAPRPPTPRRPTAPRTERAHRRSPFTPPTHPRSSCPAMRGSTTCGWRTSAGRLRTTAELGRAARGTTHPGRVLSARGRDHMGEHRGHRAESVDRAVRARSLRARHRQGPLAGATPPVDAHRSMDRLRTADVDGTQRSRLARPTLASRFRARHRARSQLVDRRHTRPRAECSRRHRRGPGHDRWRQRVATSRRPRPRTRRRAVGGAASATGPDDDGLAAAQLVPRRGTGGRRDGLRYQVGPHLIPPAAPMPTAPITKPSHRKSRTQGA